MSSQLPSRMSMGVGIRPDPDKPPAGREKYASKYDVVDIARTPTTAPCSNRHSGCERAFECTDATQ
ncbi:MAG: hypothetical protein QOE30_2672 [Mycobacterium sp.]|jgi:hypothetical protein|nr:hypothetical protein [Mycobacterium sp.]